MTKLACSIIALSFRYHSLIIPLEILVNASESVLYREVCLDKKWPSWHVPLFFSFHIYSHQWSITLNIWRKTFVSLSCFIQNKQHQKTTEGYISKYADYKLWENFFCPNIWIFVDPWHHGLSHIHLDPVSKGHRFDPPPKLVWHSTSAFDFDILKVSLLTHFNIPQFS